MTPMIQRCALQAAALYALLLSAAPALACSCVLQTVAQAKEAAVAIFEGRVTSIVDAPEGGPDMYPEHSVTLTVARSWRGIENQEMVTLRTAKAGATCGYAFAPGTSYLVYASGERDKLLVSSCSRTRPIREASEDLAALGEPVAHRKTAPAQEKSTGPSARTKSAGCASGRAGASAASLLWLCTPAVVLFRRRRRGGAPVTNARRLVIPGQSTVGGCSRPRRSSGRASPRRARAGSAGS